MSKETLKKEIAISKASADNENYLIRFTIAEGAKVLKEIEQLEAENKYLKPFEVAVKKRHNGYNPEVIKELGGKPPETPEQALQELWDEWNRMEDDYVDQIVKLQAENKQIKAKSDEVFKHTLWVAIELGKALQGQDDLRNEIKALKGEVK